MPALILKPKRAVYTALFGGYETLSDQPIARTSATKFICFTDDATLTSDTWDVRVVAPDFPLDSIRSARTIKIIGHDQLDRFDETLWIDNRVTLRRDPNEVLDAFLRSADLTMFQHSFRDKLIDEFSEVVRGGYDDPTRVYEQLIHYAEVEPAVLEERPIWTGLIARRFTPEVRETMRLWLAHVLRYSRRDQLSINLAVGSTNARTQVLPSSNNHESDWHEWPVLGVTLGRDMNSRSSQFTHSIRAPLARVAELELLMQRESAKAAELAAALESEREESVERHSATLAEYHQALAVIDDLRDQVDFRDRQLREAHHEVQREEIVRASDNELSREELQGAGND